MQNAQISGVFWRRHQGSSSISYAKTLLPTVPCWYRRALSIALAPLASESGDPSQPGVPHRLSAAQIEREAIVPPGGGT